MRPTLPIWSCATLSHDRNTDIREYLVMCKLDGVIMDKQTFRYDPNQRKEEDFVFVVNRMLEVMVGRVAAFVKA